MLAKRIILWTVAAALLPGCGLAYQASPLRIEPAAQNDQAFEEAMALVAQLNYPQALDKFEAIFPRLHAAGDTARAAEAMFWVGYCYEKQGQKDAALDWYKRVVRAYLWEPAASEAAKRLTRLEAQPDRVKP